jgi:hypothetical protein
MDLIKAQLLLISLISIMLISTFETHTMIFSIQAVTHSSTVKVKCFNLAAALITISQAHADLTPQGKSNLDSVLAEEGVAPNYASEIHLFNEMVQQIKASCDKQTKDLINGIQF